MSRYYNEKRIEDPFCDYDWDNDGFPGEYIYGDDVYVDDYYCDEMWKRVKNFPEYWVSDKGRLFSSRSNSFIEGTPNIRSGHIDVSLKRGDVRYHKYLHRLVAEAFIPNPFDYRIVRHLDDDPSNNSADNLAWGTQLDNVRDCIANGNFKYFSDEDRELAMKKRRMPVVAVDFRDDRKIYFESQQEASRRLGIGQPDIQSVISGKRYGAKGYYFAYDDRSFDDEAYMFAKKRYSRKKSPIRAINIPTGRSIIFNGLTEAAESLDVSISSISMILHGKMSRVRNWTFEYVDRGDYDGRY